MHPNLQFYGILSNKILYNKHRKILAKKRYSTGNLSSRFVSGGFQIFATWKCFWTVKGEGFAFSIFLICFFSPRRKNSWYWFNRLFGIKCWNRDFAAAWNCREEYRIPKFVGKMLSFKSCTEIPSRLSRNSWWCIASMTYIQTQLRIEKKTEHQNNGYRFAVISLLITKRFIVPFPPAHLCRSISKFNIKCVKSAKTRSTISLLFKFADIFPMRSDKKFRFVCFWHLKIARLLPNPNQTNWVVAVTKKTTTRKETSSTGKRTSVRNVAIFSLIA